MTTRFQACLHLELARGALRAIPCCGAHAKSTGEPCKRPGVGVGGRCKFHGGAVGSGRPVTHGRRSAAYRRQAETLGGLLFLIQVTHGKVPGGGRFRFDATPEKVAALVQSLAPQVEGRLDPTA